MRFTHLKVDMAQKSYSTDGDIAYKIREANYQGQTKSSFNDIDKTPFGRNKVQYSENGGYYDKGGFVYYFSGNLTIESAIQYFDNLKEDGLFGK